MPVIPSEARNLQLSECLQVAVRRWRYQRQVLKDCIAAYSFAL